jgi:bacterioferritin-associated ferredoxin
MDRLTEFRVIVCHCNVITEASIRAVVDELIDADPFRIVTPGLVYMTLGKRGRCCGCFPNAIAVIASQVALRRGDEGDDRARGVEPSAAA